MATEVDWGTKVITVYQADMTLISGSSYEFDIDQFRLDLKALEDNELGMAEPVTHRHNTEVTISGTTFARTMEIINGYTVDISPTGGWIVSCVGANHNVQDVYNNTTGPTFLPNNSAGLIVGACGEEAAPAEPPALMVKYKDGGGTVRTGTVTGLR